MNLTRPLWSALALSCNLLLAAQETRLSNLSIRAQAGGSAALVTGFTIGPGPNKTVLIRAVGPTLGAFGVDGTLADPKLALFNAAGTKIAENDDFNAADAATFASVGAFQLAAGAKDAALVATLAPGSYTAEVSGGGAATGVTLVEVYEVTGGETRLVNLSTRAQVGTGDGVLIPGITLSAGGGARRLLIRAVGPTLGSFGVPGTLGDPKLELFSGTTRIAANDNWENQSGNAAGSGPQLAAAFSQAGAFGLANGSRDAAVLTTLPPGNYTLQVSGVDNATGEALVELYDLTETGSTQVNPNSSLYFAQLRPSANAPGSLASGFASISIAADGTAIVSVNITNLSSTQTAAYLRLAGTGDYLLSLPLGQVSERPWVIGPVGIYSRNDIVKALNEGRLYVSLDTTRYPAGEVAGTLAGATGSSRFTPPTAPPALAASILTSPSDMDAARLLSQATFGPTEETIAEVRRLGVNAWIQAQMAVPQTSFLQLARQDATDFPEPPKFINLAPRPRIGYYSPIPHVWFKLAVTSPDQLRQRVAFALAEIFVVADGDNDRAEPGLAYYDMLGRHAFGSFRALLEDVTLHPMMGWYLTFLRNQKANPTKGTTPDENYAREVQQLFTLGLVQLQPDGTLLLDAAGRPIPTYDNITIAETAKVFTGWAYQNRSNNFFSDPAWDGTPGGFDVTRFYGDTNGRMVAMRNYEDYHDRTEKRIISLQQLPPREAPPTVIPAGKTGPEELKIVLDTLVAHPNTPPFISRQLIQRLVTSNPSPGYVYRVAEVFRNNGRGTRGDLGAVVTALLTDYEARSPDVAANHGYGKVKEPLLRLTGLMRVLKTGAPNGRFADNFLYYTAEDVNRVGTYSSGSAWFLNGPQDVLGQAVFRSPSVFNFFSPNYTAPGPLADAGLVAPELQITDSTLAVKVPNALTTIIDLTPPAPANAPSPSPFLRNDFSALLPLSASPAALAARMDLLLCAGAMGTATRQIVEQTVAAIPLPAPIANYPSARQHAFSGSASGLAAPKVAAFDAGARFTIEAWVFPTVISATNWTFIAGKRGDQFPVAGTYGLFNLIMNPGGRIGFEVHDGTLNSNRGVLSTAPLVAGAWTHLALTYDGAVIRLYVNGTQNAQSNVTVIPPARPEMPFSIGEGVRSDGNVGLAAFSGLISQARFWNVPRTAAQIQQGMQEGMPSDSAGLVANWLLDEGSGSSARDSSGNGHHLGPRTATTSVGWSTTDGQSLDRVKAALHVTIVSPAAALQR